MTWRSRSSERERPVTRETAEPRRSRRRITLWHGLLVLAAVLLVAVLTLSWHCKRQFRRRVAVLAAAGYPVTPEELDASYRWPESGENGADWVIGAGSYFVGFPMYRRG